MKEATDQDLLRRYFHGDEAAFATLGSRYERLVYSVCLRELGRSDLAADAAQETFLLLARNARKLSHPRWESLGGWLFLAASNTARNLRRAESRRRVREEIVGTEWEHARDQHAQSLWERLEPRLNDVLAQLRPTDREALLLRFFEQQSMAEVGQRLGIGENAAQMRVSRALERLRERLQKLGIGVSVTLLALLLEQHSVVAAPPNFNERIAIAARSGRALRPLRLVGLSVPSFVTALLIGVGLAGGIGWWNSPALPARSQVDTLRLATLGEFLSGDWEGTVTSEDGIMTPVRLHIAPSPDKQRLTYRYDYPSPRDAEAGWWTVERRTSRLIVEGRDVFQFRLRGPTLLLEGWERYNSGSEVIWRGSRQQWRRDGKRMTVTFEAGKPLKQQHILLLSKK